ncbi:MAG: single-stranded-DNA-specific exonuclease RecJ, partial [bacterium]
KEIGLEEVDLRLVDEIEKLSPFGIANEKPLFIFKDGIFDKVDLFGKEKKHLKITLKGENGNVIEAISFFANEELISKAQIGIKKNIVGNLEKSFFGRTKARIRLVDILD